MRFTKILYGTLAALLLASCEDFLDTESYTKKNTGNFPTSQADAEQMLTGVYSSLKSINEYSWNSGFMISEMASDDRLGGGGDGRSQNQGYDHLMRTSDTQEDDYWRIRYAGIYRANLLLESIDKVSGWESESEKNRIHGEAYFLRAYYYFELSQIYGEVPLVLQTEPVNLPKSPASETYARIASDLKAAIEMLPSQRYDAIESGHATKWAAEALMARVFLFYTGYYEQTSLPLVDGGSVSKEQVISWLEDCINNSGHDLLPDFRSLWPYCNEYTAQDYPYAKDNNLKWAGDGNEEVVFAVKCSSMGDWGTSIGYSNQFCLFFGFPSPSDGESSYPFGTGWGNGPVNAQLWNQWLEDEPTDVRREGSIIDIEAELPNFNNEGFRQWIEYTGYWQKKYIAINCHDANGNLTLYSCLVYGTNYNFQLAHTQDITIIRFADVLLMHSELTGTNAGMTRVRNRAGLPEVPYSLEALKKERRYELAFEGLRWFDLMRWHDAADALESQVGSPLISYLNPTITEMKEFGVGYRKRYEQTGGFWQIPRTQIDVSNGVLTQNPGWDTEDCEYWGW